MDITPFIRELLFGHDCVIIPGFGGFIGNYTPARIDRATSTFFPPLKEISFNRNLKHNDGLLAGRISAALGVGYGDARSIISTFADGVIKKLERGEKVVFDNIGAFTLNSEGSIQFEPAAGINYHLDSYGLEPFTCIPLEGYDINARVVARSERPVVHSMPLRKILWRAAVIIPLVGILAVLPFRSALFGPDVEVSSMNPLLSAELEANRQAVDNPETPVIDMSAAPEVASPPVTIAEELPPVPVKTTEGNYCLITGSFKSAQNAENQSAMLREKGYEPEILEASNGFYRVSARRCFSVEEALEIKKEMSGSFPDTWIRKL